jgi:hypothetical protein
LLNGYGSCSWPGRQEAPKVDSVGGRSGLIKKLLNETIRAFIDRINAHDVEGLGALMSDDPAWKAIAKDGRVTLWQVFADTKIPFEIIDRRRCRYQGRRGCQRAGLMEIGSE